MAPRRRNKGGGAAIDLTQALISIKYIEKYWILRLMRRQLSEDQQGRQGGDPLSPTPRHRPTRSRIQYDLHRPRALLCSGFIFVVGSFCGALK